VADGTIFEARGIPAAAVVTDAFAGSAEAMARRYGYPDYRYVAIPHPISSLDAAAIRERAAAALPAVLAVLGVESPGRG
jgi:hypothetical protein